MIMSEIILRTDVRDNFENDVGDKDNARDYFEDDVRDLF
jgi:hypothetical protein